jgi:hypothetical protein
LSDLPRDQHNLTTEEALQIFEHAGLPRDKRSIQRYCDLGKLDCEKNAEENIYYITPASVERLIGKIKELQARHAAPLVVAPGPARSDGVRHPATTPRHEHDEPPAPLPQPDTTKIKELEDKLFNLEVDKRATEKVNNLLRQQIKEDREQYFQQIQTFAKELGETKQVVGQLETQLRQLTAPKTGTIPTTGARQVTEAEVEDMPPDASMNVSPLGSSSVFGTAFADIRNPDHEERV